MKVTEVIEAIDDGMAVQAIDEKLREIVDAVILHRGPALLGQREVSHGRRAGAGRMGRVLRGRALHRLRRRRHLRGPHLTSSPPPSRAAATA